GAWRRLAFRSTGVAVGILALSHLILAVDHPSDVVFAAVLGVAFAIVPFRVYCPGTIFPVSYERHRAAHIEIDEWRERAIREALRDQLGIEAGAIEPFGEESSGGSTPLRIRQAEGEAGTDLFAKLYTETHLRAD